MALLDHLDFHVLVMTGSEEFSKDVEESGERSGVDMYFHGEHVQTSDDFLQRCEFAEVVIIPNKGSNYDAEMEALMMMNKSIILSYELKNSVTGARGVSYLDLSNAMYVYKVLKALRSSV
jgi:hypothetical protein